jgi:hypothetical protein
MLIHEELQFVLENLLVPDTIHRLPRLDELQAANP